MWMKKHGLFSLMRCRIFRLLKWLSYVNYILKPGITLCGDLNQKVYGNETIVGSLEELFPADSVTRYQLKTSYRSTKEITDFANQFLTGSDQVELTAREGALLKSFNRERNSWSGLLAASINQITVTLAHSYHL